MRVFGVRLHSMGLSLREIVAVFEWFDVDRSHGAVWNWTHALSEAQADPPTASPSRVAVDEKQITVDGEKKWLYAAIDTDSKLLLEVEVFSRRGIGPAAAFLHRFTEEHDVSDTEFLTDAGGYFTTLARLGLRGGLNYRERNLIEKWFQTVTMRIDRFHSFWRGESSQHRALAVTVQASLQPRSTESGARWTNADRGGSQLDSEANVKLSIEC